MKRLHMNLRSIIPHFHAEMRRGLAGDDSSIAMHPAYVAPPTGAERGRFVTLDLGGTNVRATVVELPGNGAIRPLRSATLRLPATVGTSDDLFRPIARFLATVIGDERPDDGETRSETYTLGFTFAFPMRQTGIRSGILTKWTKEFAFTGVEGKDVALLLQAAIEREAIDNPPLRRLAVGALANDTVAALATGAYLDSRSDMGLIVATGMNLAASIQDRIYNMECGNFDGVQSIQTEIDRRLDAASDTEGQLLEKMVSGRYLGEIARLTVLDAAERESAFPGFLALGSAFTVPYAFATEALSDIAYDTSDDLATTAMLLRSLGAGDSSLEERRRLRDICESVARRSAQLVAAAIHSTATYSDPDLEFPHLATVDGSLFRGYPSYQRHVESTLAKLAPERAAPTHVSYLRESSGVGAAIVAAAARP